MGEKWFQSHKCVPQPPWELSWSCSHSSLRNQDPQWDQPEWDHPTARGHGMVWDSVILWNNIAKAKIWEAPKEIWIYFSVFRIICRCVAYFWSLINAQFHSPKQHQAASPPSSEIRWIFLMPPFPSNPRGSFWVTQTLLKVFLEAYDSIIYIIFSFMS